MAAIAARCLDFARSLRTSKPSGLAQTLIFAVIGTSVDAGMKGQDQAELAEDDKRAIFARLETVRLKRAAFNAAHLRAVKYQ